MAGETQKTSSGTHDVGNDSAQRAFPFARSADPAGGAGVFLRRAFHDALLVERRSARRWKSIWNRARCRDTRCFPCCGSRPRIVVSLAFTLVYGYVAAYNTRAEKFMVPLLDTLQSIPVLSFLPGVMVAMVALFPTKQLGVELGSILLIFTGQVWNMTFSFYSSLKSIPREMREVAEIYRWSWWQRFTQMELPYSIIGLVWNSMMSVAGGWFFLMACEMFTLGDRDLRLPGLGSYLQTAANAGNTRAIWWGMGVMIGIIVVIDQLVWRPVIAWAEKFKFEQVESTDAPTSPVLDLLRSSRILPFFSRLTVRPAREFLSLHFARQPCGGWRGASVARRFISG